MDCKLHGELQNVTESQRVLALNYHYHNVIRASTGGIILKK